MDYDSYLALVKARRSSRVFKPEPVADEDIARIIEAARWAPSGMNSQPWEFVVVKDPDTIRKLLDVVPTTSRFVRRLAGRIRGRKGQYASKLPGFELAKNAPALVVVCGDRRKLVNLPGQRYALRGERIHLKRGVGLNQEAIFTSSLSAAFVLMLLGARSLGLGSQHITVTAAKSHQARIRSLLGLPDHYVIYDTAAIGHPAFEPRPRGIRPLEEMLHHERFDSSKMLSDVEIVSRATSRHDVKHLFAEADRTKA
jgi:FMN reductase (NADPH)